MKSTIFFCTALLASVFVLFGTGTLEARRHSHTRLSVNVGTSFVRPAYSTYVVQPAYAQPVAYPQPIYVYPSEPVIVYPAPVYQQVVAAPVVPSFNLFSFGFGWFR